MTTTATLETPTPTDVDTAVKQTPIDGHDRCDKCGAQAAVRVIMLTGELLFCAHHTRANVTKMTEDGAVFFDTDGNETTDPGAFPA